MVAQSYRRIELLPDAAEYASRLRARRNRIFGLMLATLALALGVIVAMRIFTPGASAIAPLLALAAVALCALPVLIWNNPRFGLYFLALAFCLFEQAPQALEHDLLAKVPLFWNVSTIGQHYANTNAINFVHFNIGELVMAMTAIFWLLRQITLREVSLTTGALFGWLGLYFCWCMWGFVNGLAKGGDLTFALWELRAQAYFVLAYLLAANLVTDRKHVTTLLWMLVLGIGLKSLIGAGNYLHNPNVDPDEGVLAHEDSLLIDILLVGTVGFWLARVQPRLRWALLVVAPFALIALMGNGRRAAIAAVIVALPATLVMAAVLLEERRKAVVRFLVALGVVMAVYMPIAWSSHSAWALPARALKAQLAPDELSERDNSSDTYRLAENYNLRLTRDTSPWLGYGYGRPYILAAQQVGRTDVFSNILPHNGILWIWMRLGHFGFLCFWMFVATVLVRGPNLLRSVDDPMLKATGILCIATFLMLLIYGQYDLAFANYRAMWISGTMVGLLATLLRIAKPEPVVEKPVSAGPPPDDEETIDIDHAAVAPRRLPRGWRTEESWNRRVDW